MLNDKDLDYFDHLLAVSVKLHAWALDKFEHDGWSINEISANINWHYERKLRLDRITRL